MAQKIIGLIGGMSWESSAEYYRIINEKVRDRLGGLHSARCLMWSFDFAEIEALQHAGRWDQAAEVLVEAAKRLERGGADFMVLCTNTMHRMADDCRRLFPSHCCTSPIPRRSGSRRAGFKRMGLLGTAFTMEQDFYKGRLTARHGLDVSCR